MPNLSSILGGSAPVGSIIQAPYNLTDPAWLPCDGRRVLRATYPRLSACLPSIGTFTATSRTKTAAPTSSAIAANATSWVVTGAVGTNNLYTTPDGITYTARTTGNIADTRSILSDGTNLVAANGALSGSSSHYSTDGGVTWVQTATGVILAPTNGLQTCMTWAPTLGTVGRFCTASGGTPFYTSDDRGVTWTTRNPGLGGVFHVCWTGQKFIATGATANTILTSTDGITWVTQTMPFLTTAASSTLGSIISDGAGRVLWLDAETNAGRVFTSLDHGVTWNVRSFAAVGPSTAAPSILAFQTAATANYTNGRFFITGQSNSQAYTYVSTDSIAWTLMDFSQTYSFAATFSFKAGVYLVNPNAAGATAFTLTEDTTFIKLPYGAQNQNSGTAGWNNFMPFIKVS